MDQGRRCFSLVTDAQKLGTKADHLRDEPLTADEKLLHRPDLPFAVVRRSGVTWPARQSEVTAFAAAFEAVDVVLPVADIYLRGFGPRGGSTRAVRIRSDDKAGFTAAELMRKAADLEMPSLGSRLEVEGVGVYRQGLHRGRPCFYLWGVRSMGETDLDRKITR